MRKSIKCVVSLIKTMWSKWQWPSSNSLKGCSIARESPQTSMALTNHGSWFDSKLAALWPKYKRKLWIFEQNHTKSTVGIIRWMLLQYIYFWCQGEHWKSDRILKNGQGVLKMCFMNITTHHSIFFPQKDKERKLHQGAEVHPLYQKIQGQDSQAEGRGNWCSTFSRAGYFGLPW